MIPMGRTVMRMGVMNMRRIYGHILLIIIIIYEYLGGTGLHFLLWGLGDKAVNPIISVSPLIKGGGEVCFSRRDAVIIQVVVLGIRWLHFNILLIIIISTG